MSSEPADLYRALLTSGRLAELRRLTYRCARPRYRCMLLDAVETPPLGILLHRKRYKYSDPENQRRSSEAGRTHNTEDGDRRWIGHTLFLAASPLADPDFPLASTSQMILHCDHVLEYWLTASQFHADWNAGHAEVRVRPDGSRYAVT